MIHPNRGSIPNTNFGGWWPPSIWFKRPQPALPSRQESLAIAPTKDPLQSSRHSHQGVKPDGKFEESLLNHAVKLLVSADKQTRQIHHNGEELTTFINQMSFFCEQLARALISENADIRLSADKILDAYSGTLSPEDEAGQRFRTTMHDAIKRSEGDEKKRRIAILNQLNLLFPSDCGALSPSSTLALLPTVDKFREEEHDRYNGDRYDRSYW